MQQSRDAFGLPERPVGIPQPSPGPELGHPLPPPPPTHTHRWRTTLRESRVRSKSTGLRAPGLGASALPTLMTKVENGHQSLVQALVTDGKMEEASRKGTGTRAPEQSEAEPGQGPGVLTPKAVLFRLKHDAVAVLGRWVPGMAFSN